jgi:serine/threonine protein kinase
VQAGWETFTAPRIVHRDIKPTNLVITSKDVVKILDFGLAKSVSVLPIASQDESAPTRMREEGATEAGIIMGTLAYMSPEQAKGAAATPTSDCFSLGCVLYEMLSGTAPFARGTQTATLAAILRDAPAPFEPEILGIPKELQRIVRKALAKDTSDRFVSAGVLHEELEAFRRSVVDAEASSLWRGPFRSSLVPGGADLQSLQAYPAPYSDIAKRLNPRARVELSLYALGALTSVLATTERTGMDRWHRCHPKNTARIEALLPGRKPVRKRATLALAADDGGGDPGRGCARRGCGWKCFAGTRAT